MVPFMFYVALMVVAAIVVVIAAGSAHLSRKHRKQKEPAQPEATTAAPRVV
jgi:hypothetical protein